VLHKGTLVDIKGVVTNRKYTDKEGVEKTSLELSARKWAIDQTRKNNTVKEAESSPWGN
jgi:single-stranded DNA-binding protein